MLFPTLKLAENAGVGAGVSFSWPGGYGAITFEGTAPAGSLQMQSFKGTWIDVGTATTFAANGCGGAFLPPCQVRINITGGSAVYAYLTFMPTVTQTGN